MAKPLTADIPEKLGFLFHPWRYKVAKGGRGSAKSWSFARALILKGYSKEIRVLCAREVQLSIKQSVLKLLADQIKLLGLGSFYTVLETEIRGKNGTQFMFSGLSVHTVESIKSYEGVDFCWVEEGQTISKRSWEILLPTIRKEDSEIWVSYNPDLDTDETHQRFAINTPDNCKIVNVNFTDNPWFNDVLEKERLLCQKNYPDDYPNIWEGKCRPAAVGAIYYKEVESADIQGRICNVPYDPMLKAHVVFDLGWNDSMAISVIQRNASEIRIIDYIEDDRKTLDWYSTELKEKRYNWGKVWLPHDGFSGDLKTGKTSADILRKLGWDVPSREEIVELGLEEGIRVARMTFPRVYIDKTRCAPLVECLKRYRRNVNRQTDESGAPLHDKFSHGADNFRYVCVNAERMTNETRVVSQRPFHVGYEPLDAGVGY